MNRSRLAIILLIALAVAACATNATRERLLQAESAYAAVVETATELRRAGVIDEETARELTPAFAEVNDLLSRAHEAIVDGDYGLAETKVREAEDLIFSIGRRIRQHE